MPSNKYTSVFTALKRINNAGVDKTKEEAVFEFTNGRTQSLRDLDQQELDALILKLNNLVGDPKNDAIRKAIISQFRSTGRTVRHAIAWAEKYGVNGTKKPFNEYNTAELMKLLQSAKNVKADYFTAVNKRI